ncbi:hypothetical protein [Defluviimonas sp. SAOS-178_SWC]
MTATNLPAAAQLDGDRDWWRGAAPREGGVLAFGPWQCNLLRRAA